MTGNPCAEDPTIPHRRKWCPEWSNSSKQWTTQATLNIQVLPVKSTKLRYICSRFQVPLPPPLPWSWSPASPPLWCGVVVVPWFPLVVRWWFIGLACGLYPLGYLCRPYHGGGASEPGTGITYIYIYISTMFSSRSGTAQAPAAPADFFPSEMQCPYEYPELWGTEYKTRAELYDLQNPQPATKEFLVKLLRFHICCHPTVCGMICLAMALRVEVGDGRLGAVKKSATKVRWSGGRQMR